MQFLLVLGLIFILLAIESFRHRDAPLIVSPAMVAAIQSKYELVQAAARRFWLSLFYHLCHRTVRIWRFCRRHYGWGIEILSNIDFLLEQAKLK